MNGPSGNSRQPSRGANRFLMIGRRLTLAFLTLLLTPCLLLLAGTLLLLNLASRLARTGRRPHAVDATRLSGIASIVILNWNGKDLLAQGLPSVIEAVERDGDAHEILVVDNGSDDGSLEFLHTVFPRVRVVELQQNLGFAMGNNAGVREARHDIVVLLNNDMIVDPGFLRPLLDGFGPDTFAVSSQIQAQDPGVLGEETGRTTARFRRGMIDFSHERFAARELSRPYYPVLWAGGGSSAYHRQRFLALGGFQEVFSPAYAEDTDLSFQAWRAGWEVLFAPRSIVRHKHRASVGRLFAPAELRILIQRNQFLFIWKNLQSWRLLLAHCAFLPWTCYRLARDFGPGIWRSLFQAGFRLPALQSAKGCAPSPPVRKDTDIFQLFAAPALYFARRSGTPALHPTEKRTQRVLWLTAYVPHLGRHAGAGRMYHLLKRIAQSYRVTLLTLLEGEEERRFLPELESMCERVIALPRIPAQYWELFAYEPFRAFFVPELAEAFKQCLIDQAFDLIQLEYTQMGLYAGREFGIPTLMTKHEVDFAACARRARLEANPVRKLRWSYNYLQVLDREVKLLRRVSAAICVTEPDRQALQRFCRSVEIHVINTGVDLDYFRPPEQPATTPRLVFVGAFQHEPNIDAMEFFCRSVLPRVRARVPRVELLIVGSDALPALQMLADIPGVQVVSSVPDIRPFMAAASVYIVPLRLGVGIRGKILEAWGMAIPVVATTVACAGLRYREGENLMAADSAEDMAACIVRLLEDPALRKRMGWEGRKIAEEFYGWACIASQLDELYQRYMSSDRIA